MILKRFLPIYLVTVTFSDVFGVAMEMPYFLLALAIKAMPAIINIIAKNIAAVNA